MEPSAKRCKGHGCLCGPVQLAAETGAARRQLTAQAEGGERRCGIKAVEAEAHAAGAAGTARLPFGLARRARQLQLTHIKLVAVCGQQGVQTAELTSLPAQRIDAQL